jgi:hypothetical protein
MSVPGNPQVNAEMCFAPLKLVDVAIGCVSVKLYPRITATMPVYERAHAFQVNKTILTNLLGTDFSLILDEYGTQLNSSLTVEGLISNWQQCFQQALDGLQPPCNTLIAQVQWQLD